VDLLRLRVHLNADRLREGDVNLPVPPLHNEEDRTSCGEDPHDFSDLGPVTRDHPATDDFEVVKKTPFEASEVGLGDENIEPDQGVRPGQRIDPREFQEVRVPVERQGFDREGLESIRPPEIYRGTVGPGKPFFVEPELEMSVAPLAPEDLPQYDEVSLFQ